MPLTPAHLATYLLTTLAALSSLGGASPAEVPVPAFQDRFCSGRLRVIKGTQIIGCLGHAAEFLAFPANSGSEDVSCGKYSIGTVRKGKEIDVLVVNAAAKTEFCYLTKGTRIFMCGPMTRVPARSLQLAFDSSDLYSSDFQLTNDAPWGYLRDRSTEFEPGFVMRPDDSNGLTRLAAALAAAGPKYRIVCSDESN